MKKPGRPRKPDIADVPDPEAALPTDFSRDDDAKLNKALAKRTGKMAEERSARMAKIFQAEREACGEEDW